MAGWCLRGLSPPSTINRFQQEAAKRIMLYRWTHRREADRHEWLLRRNCALRPGQLAACFTALAVVSLAIALMFASMGAWVVVPFTLLEISALAAAFVMFSRHATDYERIVVGPGEVVIETSLGPSMARVAQRAGWIRVEYSGRHSDLIQVITPARVLPVGRFVPSDTRGRLAFEMRSALAGSSV